MVLIDYKVSRIFALADTHARHREIVIPPDIDIIIHCGDVCDGGDEEQIVNFFEWFSNLKVKHKIFVAGNHDLLFDLDPIIAKEYVPEGIVYLENNIVVIEDIVFASVAARPYLHNAPTINEQVDIMITHGAPYGILDEGGGCHLLAELIKTVSPHYAVFGHIHNCGKQTGLLRDAICINVATDVPISIT